MIRNFKNISKIALSLIISVFLLITPVNAQELSPEHLALARKYVDLTDHAKIYEVSLLKAGVNTMKTLISSNVEIKDELNEAIGKTIAEYSEKKDDLFDQFARVYAAYFTLEELQEIVTFYETETGLKLSKSNGAINKDLQAVMGIFENNLNIEFFAKVRSKLKAKGIEL